MKIREVNRTELAETTDISVKKENTDIQKNQPTSSYEKDGCILFPLKNTGNSRFFMDHAFQLLDFCS
jgi:hypothetical protein